MSWRDLLEPVRMERVAIVAPLVHMRDVLAAVAAAGVVEPERIPGRSGGNAADALARMSARPGLISGVPVPVLGPASPDLAALEQDGRVAEIAGEAELEMVAASAVRRGRVATVAAWSPAPAVAPLASRIAEYGSAVVYLPIPRGVQPPTLLAKARAAGAFQPLVDTYATLPYADVNPSLFAGVAYVIMFGMMFGDVGHGALLAVAGVLLLTGRPRRIVRYRGAAPFVLGAGLASAAFGFAYGEAFGPTGLVRTLWLAPLSDPLTLMAAAIAVGAALLAVSYGLGTVNRWREGGFARALVALSGLAGIALYLGLAVVGLGLFVRIAALSIAGAVLAAIGLVLSFTGLYAATGGRLAGALEAGIELFDGIIQLGTNTISFARLAAFGLTHAALGMMVWTATAALGGRGPHWWVLAAIVFVVGNAVAFALEALVAAIQALRLEYYEMFSRIFVSPGRAFVPWHIPALARKEPS
jgi:V/A-type H+-transporting ATPase subunit I